MSEPVLIASITAIGLILSGVFVELVRARKRQDKVVHEMTPNGPNGGSSIRDLIDAAALDLRQLRAEMSRNGERLAALEAVMGVQTGTRWK